MHRVTGRGGEDAQGNWEGCGRCTGGSWQGWGACKVQLGGCMGQLGGVGRMQKGNWER